VEDENAAVDASVAIGKDCGGDFEGAGIFAGEVELEATNLGFALDLFPEFEEFVGAKNFEDGFASDFAFDGEEVVESLIDELDAAMAVEEKKAFGHAIEERLALGFGAFAGEF